MIFLLLSGLRDVSCYLPPCTCYGQLYGTEPLPRLAAQQLQLRRVKIQAGRYGGGVKSRGIAHKNAGQFKDLSTHISNFLFRLTAQVAGKLYTWQANCTSSRQTVDVAVAGKLHK